MVFARLTEPDGNIVQIGDSNLIRGATGSPVTGVFRDDEAGLVTGRWATASTTSYYTIRYGPRRWAHGHLDRGGLTWSTAGTRVLADAGHFGTDGTSAFVRWQASTAAANVAVLENATFSGSRAVSILRSSIGSTAHHWSLDDEQYGSRHLRDVTVDDAHHALSVIDSFSARLGFRQYWHLDRSWQLVSLDRQRHHATFRNSSGHILAVTTDGLIRPPVQGATRPVAGWSFPHQGQRVPVYEFIVEATTTMLHTTFQVH